MHLPPMIANSAPRLTMAPGWAPQRVGTMAMLLATVLLVWLSQEHFLWFHSLAELFAIAVGAALYLIAFNSYVFHRNNFLLFIASGFFWAAAIDTVHTLAYAGMGLIPGNDANIPTQLWLCARFMEAVTLLLAPAYLGQRPLERSIFILFGAAALAAIALVFSGAFPDAFLAGKGLTPFKIRSEYLIIVLLLLAAVHLYRRRAALDAGLYRILLGVIALTALSEFSFTLYVSVYGLSNLTGHVAKLWAFGLLLLAVSREMLARPFHLLARDASSFESVPLPVLLLDAVGVIQSCNESARHEHRDGGVGKRIHATWHPAHLDEGDCPVCQAVAKGQAYAIELYDEQLDRWYDISLQPIRRDQKLHGFICVQTDITARKLLERERRGSDAKLLAVLDNAPDAVFVAGIDGRFTYVNRQAMQLVGRSAESLMGSNFLEVIAPEEIEAASAAFRKVVALGQARTAIQLLRSDGHRVPVEVNAVKLPDGTLYGSCRDVTDRMLADQKFMRQGALLRRIIDSIPDLIFFKDTQSVYLGCNSAFTHYFGHPEAEIVGRTDLDFVDRETAELFRAKDREMLAAGVPRINEEWVIYPDGHRALLETLKTPYLDDEGHLLGLIGISRDITERRRVEEVARAQEIRLRSLFDHMLEGYAYCRLIYEGGRASDFIYLEVNAMFEQLTGLAGVIGKRVSEVFPGILELNRELIDRCGRVAETGKPERFEAYIAGLDLWSSLSVYSFEKEHFVVVFDNITERKHYEAQLEHQANYDALTGLANRNLLADRLEQAIVFAQRAGRPIAVMLLDLDRFKLVNDSLGHPCGDTLLKSVAERLSQLVRPGDTVARLGGDEFMVVMTDMGSENDAAMLAQRLLDAVSRPVELEGREVVATASLGVALCPRDGTDSRTLFKNADVAMYRAKELGRNSFQFYAPEMNSRILERVELEARLRRALANRELELFYQPQVELQRGEVVGAEALIRWRHPQLGMISPADFIPLAEETGLIVPIGEWVIDTACAQIKAWVEEGLTPVRVAVNVSARQFQQENLPNVVQEALRRHGVAARSLELEVTESAVMRTPERTIAILRKLKETGIAIALDDFGTGYSSLNYLKRFPIDILKIDQSFVRDITSDSEVATIALSVISLAHSLKRSVVAEGVESEAQLTFLQRHGCDQMQGYLFARPLPVDEFAQLLRSGRRLAVRNLDREEGRHTLLLVDDESSILSALRRELRRDGYHILTATSGTEALELLALHRVQVIVCDQRMPEMSGAEFLLRVKQMYPDTIRMVLSGYADLQSISDAINQGAVFKFLMKPWDDDQLREQIREAFQYHDALFSHRCDAFVARQS